MLTPSATIPREIAEAIPVRLAVDVFGLDLDIEWPEWYSGRPVAIFYKNDYALYSWDAHSCNACMVRENGTAIPNLPHWDDADSDAWAVLEHLTASGFIITTRCASQEPPQHVFDFRYHVTAKTDPDKPIQVASSRDGIPAALALLALDIADAMPGIFKSSPWYEGGR